MAALPTILTPLAHQAAAQVGFTARLWWRGQADPAVLGVDVERRLVGVCSTVAELTVARLYPHPARSSTLHHACRLLPGPRRRAARRGRRTVTKERRSDDCTDLSPAAP